MTEQQTPWDNIEADFGSALGVEDPLVRLAALAIVARRVDELRSLVARCKGDAALACTAAGVTQRAMAEASGVKPAMVQQWVRRGRGLPLPRSSAAE